MNTLEKLNKQLDTKVQVLTEDYSIKDLAKYVKCKDGTTLSVQASYFHYSTPRSNIGPYSEVEVWCVESSSVVTEFEYNPDEPSGYVPIEKVVLFI